MENITAETKKSFNNMLDEEFKEELSNLLKTRIPAEDKLSYEEIIETLTRRAKEVLGSNSCISLYIVTHRKSGFMRMGHGHVFNPKTGTLVTISL